MSAINYQKVFSNLCHIKALSHDNKFDEIVQHIILNVLYRNAKELIATPEDIRVKISDSYGINARQTIVTSNTDKLLSAGKIEKSVQGGIFLPIAISEKIKTGIENSLKLEEKIKADWIGDLKTTYIDKTDDELEILWQGLQMYIVQIFEQHGVQTLNLLNPQNKSKDIELSTTAVVEQIVRSLGTFITSDILTEAINSFFHSADSERVNYLAQLADATFTSYALTTDQQTTEFLSSRYEDLDLFLDTNFIFGILGLHKNTEDTAAKEILSETKKNRLPFHLRYHPETLDEFTRAFDAKAKLIKGINWTRETSRVALTVDELSPIEKLYHEENIKREIDPRIFLEKYDHIDKILKDIGLSEYPVKQDENEWADIEANIQSYEDYYNKTPLRKLKNKSYAKFKHDIVVLRDVRRLNPKKTKFLGSRAFFVSSDYVLAKFERHTYVKKYEINYVVSPSVFLQLIRPFINSDYSSNKLFVDTFTIPEFRAFEIDYSGARSTALQIINDQFHGITFEAKVKIVGDGVIADKLEQLRDNHDKQVDLIESVVAQQNAVLMEQNATAKGKIDKLSDDIKGYGEREKILTEQNAELTKGIEGYDIREKVLQEELQRTRDELEKKTKEKDYQELLTQWEKEKKSYVIRKIDEKRVQYKKDSRYAIKTFWWTLVAMAGAPFILKTNTSCLPKWASVLITVLVYLFIVGFFCWRVYLVKDKDKQRMRDGFKWLGTFGITKRKSVAIEDYRANFENKFKTDNPKPIMLL